ncbi:nitrile hydratase accessory protein [Chroococcidiopsis sp.]|uniref:nitrile hydratase accessory protein n=1 Tax=Chroococcidiopsis sp. TaxID=3088168 RepID=UPI003F3A8C21
MQTKFEHFAVTSMMGSETSPPRSNGSLKFDRAWEERAFGIAIALSKKGYYEWEEFRQELIAAIASWEATHCTDDPSWDYYQRWFAALERMAIESDLISNEELEARTVEILQQENSSTGS